MTHFSPTDLAAWARELKNLSRGHEPYGRTSVLTELVTAPPAGGLGGLAAPALDLLRSETTTGMRP